MTVVDLHTLAIRARQGDRTAMRTLHGLNDVSQGKPVDSHYQLFLERAAQGRPATQLPAVGPGQIDFFRLHALALDRLDDLLQHVLPIGFEGPSDSGRWCWNGSHPLRPVLVQVWFLCGAWNEPSTGRGGRDLVSLYAHLFGVNNGRAAHMLAEWLNVEVKAYA